MFSYCRSLCYITITFALRGCGGDIDISIHRGDRLCGYAHSTSISSVRSTPHTALATSLSLTAPYPVSHAQYVPTRWGGVPYSPGILAFTHAHTPAIAHSYPHVDRTRLLNPYTSSDHSLIRRPTFHRGLWGVQHINVGCPWCVVCLLKRRSRARARFQASLPYSGDYIYLEGGGG